jgi:hypothetical protein
MFQDVVFVFVRSLWLCAFVVQFFSGKNDELELTTTLTTKTRRHKDELNDSFSLCALFLNFVCFVVKIVNPYAQTCCLSN